MLARRSLLCSALGLAALAAAPATTTAQPPTASAPAAYCPVGHPSCAPHAVGMEVGGGPIHSSPFTFFLRSVDGSAGATDPVAFPLGAVEVVGSAYDPFTGGVSAGPYAISPVVPEPATLALLAPGVLGILGWQRSRMRRRPRA